MANEITINTSMTVLHDNLSFTHKPGSQTWDQDAVGGPTPGMKSIGTSEETEAFAELSTLGWCMMQNLDQTNYIEWGFSTGVYGGRLEPGETALFRLNPSTTLYLKANLAACKILINALED